MSSDSVEGEFIFLIFVIWLLIGTCNSCVDSKEARNQAIENGEMLKGIDNKIDDMEKKIKKITGKKDTLIIY